MTSNSETSKHDAIANDPLSAAIWLGALIDGEGCVWIGKLKRGANAGDTRRIITIGMTDPEVIRFAMRCLTTLGIKYDHTHKPRTLPRKSVDVVAIAGQEGIRRLADLLFLSHDGKRQRLAELIESYKPRRCSRCGVDYHQRTRGCSACTARMKYRRLHGLDNVAGRSGRLPKHHDIEFGDVES